MSLSKYLYRGPTLDADGLEYAELARFYYPSLDLTHCYTGGDVLVALFYCHIFPTALTQHIASYLDVWTKVQEPAPAIFRLTHQIRMRMLQDKRRRNHRAETFMVERSQLDWSPNYQPLKFWFEQRVQREFCPRCGEKGVYHYLMRKGTCHHCQLEGREREIVDDRNWGLNSYLSIRKRWSCVFAFEGMVEALELHVPGYEDIFE